MVESRLHPVTVRYRNRLKELPLTADSRLAQPSKNERGWCGNQWRCASQVLADRVLSAGELGTILLVIKGGNISTKR